MRGRLPTVPPDRHHVLNAKVLTFTGQKRIGGMLVEAVEGEVATALADLQ